MKKIWLICFLLLMGTQVDARTKKVVITPDGNQMKFAVTSFTVKAGQKVKLIMDNTATVPVMKHNVVILSDKTAIQDVGMAAMNDDDYIPDHPSIIAATPMADAGEKTKVTFRAPKTPGEYVYICTFPGHYMMMQGTMIVK